jgi:uncharacterized membrane protein HdeD (DUF308 family)
VVTASHLEMHDKENNMSYTNQGLCLAYGGCCLIGAAFSSIMAAAALVGVVMVLHGCILCVWGSSG